jgi:hypothetical protein
LLDHCRSLPTGPVELLRLRSSIGSIRRATASSSSALSSANDPGASPGARMNVVRGTLSATTFWLTARLRVVYHSREVMCPVNSTNAGAAGALHHESCRIATSVPSRSAPRLSSWRVSGRFAVAVNTCSRVSAALTGRPSALAAAAARKAGVEVVPFPPNAPPTNGLTACTADGSSPSAAAMSACWKPTPWLPL